MVMFLQSSAEGSKSAEGGKNPLADMDPGGPNPLADMDWGGSISASGFGSGGPNPLGHRRSIPGVVIIYGLSFLLVLFSALSPGAPVFPSL